MDELVLICEDSLEGILTAVYEAYALKSRPEQTYLQIGEEGNLRLFAEYVSVAADASKAAKVSKTVIREMGEDTYWDLCCIIASTDGEKGQAVYQAIAEGLKTRRGRSVLAGVSNPYIRKAFELARAVNNEIHRLKQFLRFQELENGLLYAKIGPKNNIATFLAPHFSDRFPLENFVIHDEVHGVFVIHPARRPWLTASGGQFEQIQLPDYSEEEKKYQELFINFFHTIAVKERKNRNLQRNMLPIRFQDYMVEFSR